MTVQEPEALQVQRWSTPVQSDALAILREHGYTPMVAQMGQYPWTVFYEVYSPQGRLIHASRHRDIWQTQALILQMKLYNVDPRDLGVA